jgi:hypothetical protein
VRARLTSRVRSVRVELRARGLARRGSAGSGQRACHVIVTVTGGRATGVAHVPAPAAAVPRVPAHSRRRHGRDKPVRALPCLRLRTKARNPCSPCSSHLHRPTALYLLHRPTALYLLHRPTALYLLHSHVFLTAFCLTAVCLGRACQQSTVFSFVDFGSHDLASSWQYGR